MNSTRTDYRTLREQAIRRANELRREAIVHAWDALFAALSRIAKRRNADPAHRTPKEA